MKINYVIVDVARAWTLRPFLPQRRWRCSVPMGNSNSARRQQSRSVPTSPEVRIRFRLQSPCIIYNIVLQPTIAGVFFLIYIHIMRFIRGRFDEVIVNFYCYRLPGPTLHSGSITNIPTPFAQRFHQLQNTPAANSEYTYLPTYLPATCIWLGRGNFY